jgi:uncharacterized protein (DUF362 family)|nr:DUF362 domain-containing protein [uncultured Acetatifactor sp.]
MNYLYYDKALRYPSEKYSYSPSINYPEYVGDDVAPEENQVYDAIRKIFIHCGLDKENYGTKKWNPLGSYVCPGDTVLIKPNLVLHKNNLAGHEDSLDCLVTHPSIIRCVLDYVLIALSGSGDVYIGDSPVKDCNLPLLLERHHYNTIQHYYKGKNHITWVDLRGPEEERQNSTSFNGVQVNLQKESYFYNYSNQEGLRIPNYNYRKVVNHHRGEKQEYSINELVLRADVIINLPKPKTHRKSGYTGALKNFVGINYSKEFLPHHTVGDKKKGGDEFYKQTLLKRHASYIRSCRDIIRTNSAKHMNSRLFKVLSKYENVIRCVDRKINNQEGLNTVTEGTWYCNDTLWRTVLDLNKVVHYTNVEGKLENHMTRKVIHLCDMVISGEQEGPLAPSEKEENILLFGTNGVELDALIVRLMHFDVQMLPTIKVALENHLLEAEDYDKILIHSNMNRFDDKLLINEDFSFFEPFKAAKGWESYIEE